ASVFGQRFPAAGVVALVRSTVDDVQVELDALVRSEILVRPVDASGFGFRHALLREAAYAMLTDEDRRLGHLLAAEWLAAGSALDAAVIAEHFEQADQPQRAVAWFRRAAEQ